MGPARHVGSWLRLCRLHYTLPFAFGYVLIAYYARGGAMQGAWAGTWAAGIAVLLVVAAAYAANDAADVAVDRVNAPGRPIAAGAISARAAVRLAVALAACGLLAGLAAGPAFAGGLAAVAAGLAVYDLRSKRLGPWKPVAVAALLVSLYPLAFLQAGGFSGTRARTLFAFPVWLFLTAFAYEVLKDLRDARGDRLAADRSTPLQRAPRRWRRLAGAATWAGVGVALLPAGLGCGPRYLAVAAPGLLAGLASAFLPLRLAIPALYAEVFLVALAAAVDVAAAAG
jgi:4-hydroxybenzoate polyprenyltransferase